MGLVAWPEASRVTRVRKSSRPPSENGRHLPGAVSHIATTQGDWLRSVYENFLIERRGRQLWLRIVCVIFPNWVNVSCPRSLFWGAFRLNVEGISLMI